MNDFRTRLRAFLDECGLATEPGPNAHGDAYLYVTIDAEAFAMGQRPFVYIGSRVRPVGPHLVPDWFENDGYIGSSAKILERQKRGLGMIKHIVQVGSSTEIAALETETLRRLDAKSDVRFYNRTNHGVRKNEVERQARNRKRGWNYTARET